MSTSSCSPSSSAVTIPIPGKSILKRPPPPQTGFLTRIKGLLPTPSSPAPPSTAESRPLKRAHFILPQLVTVYPISSLNPPSTPALKDEKRAIEEREYARRRRVLRGAGVGTGGETEEWWALEKVESFYRECCASREEDPDPAISAAFKRASASNPRSVDLSGAQLTLTSAAILSDVFTIEWGLRKLTLRECDLDDLKLKPLLHALLIPGTLVFLSVASNRRIKAPGFRLLGAYVARAKSLQFLDLSQTTLDKKSIDPSPATDTTLPNTGLVSLRLDDCALKPAALEALSRTVRTSSLRNISLRHNRITATGAVALALMIRDYPDAIPVPGAPSSPAGSVSAFSPPPSPMSPSFPNPQSPATNANANAPPPRPPPRHPAAAGPQTTYTPYIPRARRAPAAVPAHANSYAYTNPLSATGHPVPIITSNSQGGITTRHEAGGGLVNGSASAGGSAITHNNAHAQGPSAALLDKVRALDTLPRLGALRTLDLRGNDLRSGVTYIAQVLKRNRTLKVLNLAENKLDVGCLVAIAEALKYNLSLETLDLSRNPCSGPGLEGIQSLRTAFTLNTALKRLFLSSTALTSAGAIALAEFLPESTSLLHLDLTQNALDLAGVMALSGGLKANRVLRCLDVNIPPDDEEFARMCRDILNTCVRNTEEAEKAAPSPSGKGLGKGVWGMIEESELAKSIRQGHAAASKVYADVASRARAILAQMHEAVASSGTASKKTTIAESPSTPTATSPPTPVPTLIQSAKDVVAELSKVVRMATDADGAVLEELLGLCDQLNAAIAQLSPAKVGLGLKIDGGPSVRDGTGVAGAEGEGKLEEEEEEVPVTPRVDKGKARAEPEPEEPEKVLSPTFMIESDQDEDEDDHRSFAGEGDADGEADGVGMPSPTDRSRIWVEEEGEVFRKGTVLLGPEEMEGEYAGEDLRRELLDAMVERPPPRGFIDEFGMEIVVQSPGDVGPLSPAVAPVEEEPKPKPAPRPYISRTRSSSNGSGQLDSPTSPVSPAVRSPVPGSPSVRSPISPSRPFPQRSWSSPPSDQT
ncbi:RNI-like protein [Leucogyrophana mollusca]|uniref:RNI-like protein n=1 Tax=Leucogyrophana mollusca TaxID=85980 RepID=A0ACB8BWI4_9AGAM|nr:RNI-like protein [Leucogyrophana mollusca]